MKEFNLTGVCIPQKHYMVNTDKKLEKIEALVEKGKYFTINRARQYGKTTTISQISKLLKNKYIVIDISFEGLGNESFETIESFSESFITLLTAELEYNKVPKQTISKFNEDKATVDKWEMLSNKITQLINELEKEAILIIDEVDKSSNNQLFLHFLGMLRNKYLLREREKDHTFKSIILAGVYDVKNLKLKLRPGEEQKFNSPWNIATEFTVDMSFNPEEISTMLEDYENEYHTGMNIKDISEEIYKYTSGYPFLVSKICKTIDEELGRDWSSEGIEKAVKNMLLHKNTLFDDLIKNIENNKELYSIVFNLIIENETVDYNPLAYEVGIMFGILKNHEGRLTVHNKIFEICLYNYMTAKLHIEDVGRKLSGYTSVGLYENENGTLDIKTALRKYQEYMKSVYNKYDRDFIERQGRLLLIAFFKPILNGKGFYFVESHTGYEQRQDLVLTYNKIKYIIELKVWRGEKYHQTGLKQLKEYLLSESLEEGFVVIYYKRDEKEYKEETYKIEDKNIFCVWV